MLILGSILQFMVEKIAYSYLIKLTNRTPQNAADSPLLSDENLLKIKKVVRYTLFWAALFGIVGVLALYLPQYYFPAYFPDYILHSPFSGDTIGVPFVSLVYGVVLVFIELYALVALNIRAVFKIAEICGFPDKNDPD
jgi:hypothetical protein